jgi:predicted CXXCH cytochrome family protein
MIEEVISVNRNRLSNENKVKNCKIILEMGTMSKHKFSSKWVLWLTMVLCSWTVFVCASATHGSVFKGAEFCLSCHEDKASYMNTMHPKKVQGPPSDQATPVLTTMIDGEEVSIFDSRTEGYETYIAPWIDYFNEDNVEYTIGSKWKQRFMTKVVPETVDGINYTGIAHLPDNDYVVMGIMWNPHEERWQNYHGPTKENNWYTEGRLTRKKCGGCHTTGFNPDDGTWADKNSPNMQKGVTCESCHGPTVMDNHPQNIVHPENDLNFIQQFELCGSCHGRGSSVAADGVSPGQYGFPYSEAFGRGYWPGDNLSYFYIQTTSSSRFWPNGPGGTNGNSKSHHQQYNDSLLSEQHLEAEVGCIDCHSSHSADHHGQIRMPANELCISCHDEYADPDAYRRHSVHDADAARCIDCHMPYTAKSINAFDIRSHTFAIIPPSETISQGGDPDGFSGPFDTSHIPNSCNSSCHNGQGLGPLKTNAIAQLGLNYIRSLNGTLLVGDLNDDGIVDFRDLAVFTANWLKEAHEHDH